VTWLGFLAVGVGAALGAWARWGLGILFNPVFPTLPLGTLAANLTGGLLIGITMGMLSHFESLPPEMRLLVVTGFLGAMTTFSTFSAETVSLIARQQWGWAAALIFAHLAGSLLMTLAGIGAARLLLR
jgi:fluoride exporter